MGNHNKYISKKNRQHNGQKKKYKRTNNDLLNSNTKSSSLSLSLSLSLSRSLGNYEMVSKSSPFTDTYDSQRDKQRSIKHTHRPKDRVTRNHPHSLSLS